jgi:hypothetical protein
MNKYSKVRTDELEITMTVDYDKSKMQMNKTKCQI